MILSDYDAQCVISKNSLLRPITNDKFKNKFKPSLVKNNTTGYFSKNCYLKKTWDNVYLNSDVNVFDDFLKKFLNIFEASFPVIYICNSKAKGLLPQVLKRPCPHKRSLHLISTQCDGPKLTILLLTVLFYLRKVFREAKKLYYEYVIETPENKIKITWNTICSVARNTPSLV